MQEAGHTFLARMGKTRLRPGGIQATSWLLDQVQLNKDTQVLEVACNMGTTMMEIAQKYECHITGIDLDPKAIEKAKRRIHEKGLDHQLHVQVGNAFSLPFADRQFDIIINEAMLTMLSNDQKAKALQEYARVLKPGGYLLTQDVYLNTEDLHKQMELRHGLSTAIHVGVVPLTLSSWTQTIQDHGFTTHKIHGKMTLLSPLGMIRDEGSWGTIRMVYNALKTENRPMFSQMFQYFCKQKNYLGYVAYASQRIE